LNKRTRTPLLILVLVILSAQLITAPDHLLTYAGHALQEYEPLPQNTDAIFILLGSAAPRAVYSATLFKEGKAPLIAFGESAGNMVHEFDLMPREHEVVRTILLAMGVPDSCIVVLPDSVASTYDEASLLSDWAARERFERILAVTSSYHSRRAKWILTKFMTPLEIEVQIAAVPAPAVDWEKWWLNEDGLVTVFNEAVKTAYYRIKYRGPIRD